MNDSNKNLESYISGKKEKKLSKVIITIMDSNSTINRSKKKQREKLYSVTYLRIFWSINLSTAMVTQPFYDQGPF